MAAEIEPAPGGLNMVYNHAGRPASSQGAAGTFSYVFNAKGLRAVKVDGAPSAARFFHYDRDGQLIAESDLAGTMLREFVTLDGLPLALYNAGASMRYVHPDHLGGPQKMTNADGTVRWDLRQKPFGELVAAGGGATQNPQRFPGQYYDAEFGIHQNHFRDYDPTLGRYLQSDPIGLEGGINTYAYVGNNPVNRIDPLGLQAVPAPGLPIPIPLPPVAIPGTPENQAFVKSVGQLIQKFKDLCKNDDKDECEKKLQQDDALCVAIAGARYGRAGIVICKRSAMQRYSECLSSGVDGIRTPLHGVDTPL